MTDVQALGDETLVFMHLPKTGGTALRASLIDAFDASATALVYPAADLDGALTRAQFEALPEATRARMRLVMGHFRYGIHESIPRPCRYATVLRDPVERVVSLYYHYRTLPGIRFGSRGHRERLRMRLGRRSLEDWVFGEGRRTADNVAVRNITGRGNVPFGECTDGMLEEALERVDRHFIALLVTEHMGESTELLSARVERRLARVGIANENPKRPSLDDVDARVLDRIRELNWLDVRLHRVAIERLLGTSAAAEDGR